MVSFDLWMSRGVDTFVLITHLSNHNWEFGHVTISLFETIETSKASMAIQVNEMLVAYGFNIKILAYAKDEGNNLCTMTIVLSSIIYCKVLGLTTPFIGSYWGHAMFKCCKYAIDNIKVYIGLTSISIKNLFCKNHHLDPKKWKGRQEWQKTCLDMGICPHKFQTPLKTRFVSKVILF
jgi:hypothetical protein